ERRQHASADETGSLSQEGVNGQFGPLADYVRAKQTIELLRARVAEFSRDLRPKHPIIVALNGEIALQERLITTYREQSRAQLSAERDSIRVQIENLEAQIKEWQT